MQSKRLVGMLHMGRCGSTVLARMLRQHDIGEIEWDGEVFERQFNGDLTDHRSTPPLALLAQRLRESRSGVFGFETKCLPDQHLTSNWVNLTVGGYIDSLHGLGFTDFIVLRRQNYLRQLVSLYTGWKRGRWHLNAGEVPSMACVTIDPLQCGIGCAKKPICELFRELDITYDKIRRSLQSDHVLELAYELDIEPDPQIAYRKIADRLGLRPMQPSIPLIRSNPFPLHEVVVNFEEVSAHLAETDYAWMLENGQTTRCN